MSLYADYIKERNGRGILENENGFATFEYVTDKLVYIVDLYVIPEKRKTHVASQLADQICAIAKESGRTQMLGSVDLSTKGSQESIKTLLAYGMKLTHTDKTVLYFVKEI